MKRYGVYGNWAEEEYTRNEKYGGPGDISKNESIKKVDKRDRKKARRQGQKQISEQLEDENEDSSEL